MMTDAEIVTFFRRTGHKPTPQRLLTLAVLRGAGGHLTTAEVFEQVQRVYQSVTITAIHRILEVCAELNLVSTLDFGTHGRRYEWVGGAPHAHLVCRGCGQVRELPRPDVAPLAERLERRHRFTADLNHLVVFGACHTCDRPAA